MSSDKDYSLSVILQDVARTNKGFIVGYVLIGLLTQMCWVFSPYTFARLVDSKSIFSSYVVIPVLIFLVGYALEYCSDALDYFFTERLNAAVAAWSTKSLFLSFRRRFPTTKMTENINTINRLSQTCTHVFRDGRIFIMGLIFASFVCVSFLFWIHPTLGGYLMGGVLCLFVLVGLFIYRAIHYSSATEHTRDEMLDQIMDTLVNMPSVFANNQVDNELDRIQQSYNNVETSNKYAQKQIQQVRIGINIFYVLIVAGLFLLSAFLYRQEKLSAGLLATVVAVTMYMIYNFDELSINSGNLIRNIGQLLEAQRVLNDLQKFEQANPDGSNANPPTDGTIVITNLTVTLGDNVVVQNLNVTIASGEVVVITGRNGCGKSTLIKTIFGGLPYTGSILFGGQEVRDLQAKVLRENITYVPQVPHLFHRTVYENISYGNNASRDDVLLLMDQFNIDFVGLDDIVGSAHLSGGQQQLLYLLRACLHKTSKLILLDEPTSALDNKTRDRAMNLISRIIQGRTVLIITHDDDLVKYSTRAINMST